MSVIPKAFITGCDTHTEWMLPWFADNYRMHNTTPIYFCDFGVSKQMRRFVDNNFDGLIPGIMDRVNYIQLQHRRWFLKPLAMIYALDIIKTGVWIDTDCEILGNVEAIFDFIKPKTIALAEDKPWTIRRGSKWYNSGVVGFSSMSSILGDWHMQSTLMSSNHDIISPIVGDQDALHTILQNNSLKYLGQIEELPNKYNWLRLQLEDGHDSPDKLIMHWTGPKGKDIIKKKMLN